MPHWRNGKLPPNADGGELGDQEVKVVDKLPKVPPSRIVFLTYDAKPSQGETIGAGPATAGSLIRLGQRFRRTELKRGFRSRPPQNAA